MLKLLSISMRKVAEKRRDSETQTYKIKLITQFELMRTKAAVPSMRGRGRSAFHERSGPNPAG